MMLFMCVLQRMIHYRYNVLKQILRQYKLSHAIRIYIPSRKSRVYSCSYETWSRVAFLSIANFEGITYDEMIQKYKASGVGITLQRCQLDSQNH